MLESPIEVVFINVRKNSVVLSVHLTVCSQYNNEEATESS